MNSASSRSKQEGAATAAATDPGAKKKDSGSVSLMSSAGELSALAEEEEQKVLNEELMERVLSEENLRAAYLSVKGNKGAPGIDHITTEELGDHLRKHLPGLKNKILEGRYKPSPVRPVSLPKPGGGTRKLGIPTAQDRFIQQALHQELDQIFDPTFSNYSFGFRRQRSAHDAVRCARAYVVEEKRTWVVDIDIKAFFDHIDHDGLSGSDTLRAWQRYLRGWVEYFRLSERWWDWEDLEGWIRRHIRKWFWIRWHNWRGRRNAFQRLGVRGPGLRVAHSSKGAWPVSRALNWVLKKQWLREKGFWVPSDLVKGMV